MNGTTGVMWRRLKNLLSPQLDIYTHLAERVENKSVLEVGFGTGVGSLQLSRLAYSVDACEVDPDAVKFAKQLFSKGVVWFEHDITEDVAARHDEGGMPLPPLRYDVIVCIETLEHIPDYQKALENINFYLRPNGVAYISGPNANADLRKTDLHEREFTAKEFREELHKVFSTVELFDYSLTTRQGDNSTATPLMAVCGKRG